MGIVSDGKKKAGFNIDGHNVSGIVTGGAVIFRKKKPTPPAGDTLFVCVGGRGTKSGLSIADASDSLIAMNNKAAAEGYKNISIERGMYVLQEQFVINDGVGVFGSTWWDGHTVHHDNPKNTTIIKSTVTGNIPMVFQPYYVEKQALFMGIVFDGEGQRRGMDIIGNISIAECTFQNCNQQTALYGGCIGAMSAAAANIILKKCLFKNNIGYGWGCAISANSIDITGCVFYGNSGSGSSSTSAGGTIYIQKGNIVNCLFYNNVSLGRGAAIYAAVGATNIINCTITKNKGDVGGGICCYTSGLKVRNTVLWGNTARAGNEIYYISAITPEYSAIVGGGGTNGVNLSALNDSGTNPPYFSQPSTFVGAPSTQAQKNELDDIMRNNGYSFHSGTLIEKGNNPFVANIPTDIIGNPRIIGNYVDIGCYENLMSD